MGCESCESRGLAREELGCVDLIRSKFLEVLGRLSLPFPEVVAVFCFVEVFKGASSGGRILV